MKKHLVVKYFDTYPEAKRLFDTKEEAVDFVERENSKSRNMPNTKWEYRGDVKKKSEELLNEFK